METKKIFDHGNFFTCELSNGLRIVQMPSASKVVYCGYVFNVGTRDEETSQTGMAHFVEHLLFKGTKRHKAWHILNRMERVGGDLNAFTNKEETTIYSIFLEEYFQRAVELLTDMVFNSTFPQEEIDKEVNVIIDEIQSYEDSPGELIFDDFEAMLFKGHSLGHAILGNPKTLRTFRTEDELRFIQRYYRPNNCVFFLHGNVKIQVIARVLERLTSNVGYEAIPQITSRIAPPVCTQFSEKRVRKVYQSHILLGSRAYDAHDSRRTSLYLLNNILGGPGMNSRLNVSLREKHALVYNVESNLTSYTDCGTFSVYYAADPLLYSKCSLAVSRELKLLCDKRLTPVQLAAAKQQIMGQLAISFDDSESLAMDLGKSVLHYNRFDTLEGVYKRVEKITSDDLLEVANEVIHPSSLSSIDYESEE